MKNVLLFGSKLSYNFGGPSILLSTLKLFPKEHYKISFCPQSNEDNKDVVELYKNKSNVNIIPTPRQRYLYLAFVQISFAMLLPKSISLFFISKITKTNPFCKLINEFDIVCDIRGISQTDFFGTGIKGYIGENILLAIAKLLGKKAAKLTQDMGPFQRYSNKISTQFFFKKYDLIIARGIVTKELLNEIGISNNVIVKPDTAFLMESAPEEELKSIFVKYKLSNNKFILIAPSRQIDKRSEKHSTTGISKYLSETVNLLNKITDNYSEFDIVLLPNERLRNNKGTDDLTVCEQLYSLCKDKDKIKIIKEDFNAYILKGIISNSYICISSRYHTTVAAISTAIPVLVVGWGYKYDQLLSVAGIQTLISNHKTFNSDLFYTMFMKVMNERDRYSNLIATNLHEIKFDILNTTETINDILDIK